MRHQLTIRPATPEDAADIGARLCDADREQLTAASDAPAAELLRQAVEQSPYSRVAEYRGEVIALWGVLPIAQTQEHLTGGAPWMVRANKVGIRRKLSAHAEQIAAEMLTAFPFLYGLVDIRNTRQISFLVNGGFELGDTYKLGRAGELFQSFWLGSPQ